jgi:hypothetical protein
VFDFLMTLQAFHLVVGNMIHVDELNVMVPLNVLLLAVTAPAAYPRHATVPPRDVGVALETGHPPLEVVRVSKGEAVDLDALSRRAMAYIAVGHMLSLLCRFEMAKETGRHGD